MKTTAVNVINFGMLLMKSNVFSSFSRHKDQTTILVKTQRVDRGGCEKNLKNFAGYFGDMSVIG